MIRLVFVKLPNGKIEEFDATQLSLEAGEDVIVETEKGFVLGKVLSKKSNPESHSRRLRAIQGKPAIGEGGL
jgi:cell fate regulator YaaT (PSP1 superfamily)